MPPSPSLVSSVYPPTVGRSAGPAPEGYVVTARGYLRPSPQPGSGRTPCRPAPEVRLR